MSKKVPVTVYFDAQVLEEIKQLAQADDRTVANYIEQLVCVSIHGPRDLKLEMNPVLEPVRRALATQHMQQFNELRRRAVRQVQEQDPDAA